MKELEELEIAAANSAHAMNVEHAAFRAHADARRAATDADLAYDVRVTALKRAAKAAEEDYQLQAKLYARLCEHIGATDGEAGFDSAWGLVASLRADAENWRALKAMLDRGRAEGVCMWSAEDAVESVERRSK